MKKLFYLVLILILGYFAFQGCEFEVTTANISDVKMCTNFNGSLCNDDVPVFNTSEGSLYASCKLKNAPENTQVTFTWKYLEGQALVIDQVTLNSADKGINLDLHTSLSRPNNGWPQGKYAVEIAIGNNDTDPEVKHFEIR